MYALEKKKEMNKNKVTTSSCIRLIKRDEKEYYSLDDLEI